MAAERADLRRERSGIEPNRHVQGQPSSGPWKWFVPLVGVLVLFKIATETIIKRPDLRRERSGIEPNRHVQGQPSSGPWKWSLAVVGLLALLGLAGWQSIKHPWGMQNSAK